MNSPLRTFSIYLACVAILLGAMAFVTRRALDLEERERAARGRASLQERIRLALWRMDSTMTAVLARESARPYFHYMPFFPAGSSADADNTDGARPLVPSPLLTSPSDFVQLYFQVTPDGRVTSPQVPQGGQRGLAIMTDADPAIIDRASEAMTKLSTLVASTGLESALGVVLPSSDQTPLASSELSEAASVRLAGPEPVQQSDAAPQSWADLPQRQVVANIARTGKENPAAEKRAEAPRGSVPGGSAGVPAQTMPQTAEAPPPSPAPQAAAPPASPGDSTRDLGSRSRTADASVALRADTGVSSGPAGSPLLQFFSEDTSLQAYCVNVPVIPDEPASPPPSLDDSVLRKDPAPRAAAKSAAPQRLTPQLFLVREVTLDGVRTLQGAWLDWPVLRAQLLNSIGDLLPGASLEPIPSQGVWNGQVVPMLAGEPPLEGESLASIPARLVVPPTTATALLPPPTPLLSATRVAIFVGWLAILAATVIIGLVLRTSVQLIERRGRFVSAVTHELRTPLTTFCLYSQMLADGIVTDEKARAEYHSTLRAEADRLSRIVESVLDYARLGKRKRGEIWPRVPAAELFSRIAAPAAARAEACGLRLDVRSRALDDAWVRVDPAAIERIVQNLVDNACKYASDADDRSLSLTAERSGSRVVISVADSGPGVPAHERRRIFRPFQRGKAQSDGAKPGLGLGLAFARGLARDMGGDLVLAKPQPARGACFELRLRTVAADPPAPSSGG